MTPVPAPPTGEVAYRPWPAYPALVAPVLFLAMFGVVTLFQAAFDADGLRSTGRRAIIALIVAVVPLVYVYLTFYRQPWRLRTSEAGLDLRTRQSDQPVHVPWSAVTSVRMRHRQLHVGIAGANAGEHVGNRWKQLSVGRPGPDGQLLLTVDVGVLRPSPFRLGVDLARHLPAEVLVP